jgi:hypothetical protein
MPASFEGALAVRTICIACRILRGYLGDLGDLDGRQVLAVATDLVDALLGLVADAGDLVSLGVGFDDVCSDLDAADRWSADLDVIAVDDHQRLKGDLLIVTAQKFDIQGVAN